MKLYDLRKPRRFDPREVKPLIIDTNRFNRNLMSEIMRTISVLNVQMARNEKEAVRLLDEHRCTIVIVEWSELNEMDVPALVRSIRRLNDDFCRRVPIIASSSSFTREQLVSGRTAGIDEFLKKPCSPNDVVNRLTMVIETPRPFVDSKTYIGPCRRRKNPADYHGPRRRSDDEVNAIKKISNKERDLIDKNSPLIGSVSRIKMCCSLLLSDARIGQERATQAFINARRIAEDVGDPAFLRALQSFEKYVERAVKADALERRVMQTGVSTLEQLVVLPTEYAGPRMTIAQAFEDAIERKIAA